MTYANSIHFLVFKWFGCIIQQSHGDSYGKCAYLVGIIRNINRIRLMPCDKTLEQEEKHGELSTKRIDLGVMCWIGRGKKLGAFNSIHQ